MSPDVCIREGGVCCQGDWRLNDLTMLNMQVTRFFAAGGAAVADNAAEVVIDGSQMGSLDTAGAMVLVQFQQRLVRADKQIRRVGFAPAQEDLLRLVEHSMAINTQQTVPVPRPLNALARIGRQTLLFLRHGAYLLAFLGESTVINLRALARPGRMRWKLVAANLESAGFNAVAIVGLLSFLIGVAIAFQGGSQLKVYGANIFVVDLVSLTMVRELAPLLTSIIVAGRTGSAYAAQIGTMKINEEVDALRIIGIHPFEVLVLPKLLALAVALPLLTVFADITSILGGMVVGWLLLDISFADFIARVPQVVTPFSFFFGVGKTPVFAFLIASIACYQGFNTRGGADGVGRQTTKSVVQGIFLVIVADAVFAIAMGTKGIWR